MSFLRELGRKFRGELPSQDEEKKIDALQVWGNLVVLEEKAHLKDIEFTKLEKRIVPEGLREWKHYDDMPDVFMVDLVRTENDELDLKVISGSHYYRVKIAGPNDIMPTLSEGLTDPRVENPIQDLKESPLSFAFYFSRFVFHHWRQSLPPGVLSETI